MLSSLSTKVRNLIFIIYSAAVSAMMLFICSASSPAYAVNPWPDSNAFFTVGKAMANGLTVYKDIFEQKGPLLYFLHALAYDISNTGFLGVFVFEVLFLSVALFFVYRITSLYLHDEASLVTIPLFAGVTLNTLGFYYGDSVEEFCLPFLMISLYYFLRFLKYGDDELNGRVLILNGFLAGCAAMMKFTLVGFWFGWMAFIALKLLFTKKVKEAFKYSFLFLLGMGISVGIWAAYFAYKGALKDFINVYFVINATAYTVEQTTLVSKIMNFLWVYGRTAVYDPVAFALTVLGAAMPLFIRKLTDGKFFSRIAVLFVYAMGVFTVYWGGRMYPYYFLVFNVFSVIGFAGIGMIIKKLIRKNRLRTQLSYVLCVAVLGVCVFISAQYSQTALFTEKNKEDTPQYKIAQYIDSHNSDGSVLMYGRLDCGAYLMNNTVPAFRHFERQNIASERFSENTDEQNRYINEHLADYVVCFDLEKMSIDDACYNQNARLKTDYELVLTAKGEIAKTEVRGRSETFNYYLFELKEES